MEFELRLPNMAGRDVQLASVPLPPQCRRDAEIDLSRLQPSLRSRSERARILEQEARFSTSPVNGCSIAMHTSLGTLLVTQLCRISADLC